MRSTVPRRKTRSTRDVTVAELMKQLEELLAVVAQLRLDVDALKGGVIR